MIRLMKQDSDIFDIIYFQSVIGNSLKLESYPYYDLSYCSFIRCCSEYGGGFSILQGTLEGSHLVFEECCSTGYYVYGDRNAGGGSFLFYGHSASLSCISIFNCSNKNYSGLGVIAIANDLDDELNGDLKVSHVSFTSCYSDRFYILFDHGNQEVDKMNVSRVLKCSNSVIHFGYESLSLRVNDLMAQNITGQHVFYNSAIKATDRYLTRSCFININAERYVLTIQQCNLYVRRCSFIDYNTQIGYLSGNVGKYIFEDCEFSETWETINCRIGRNIPSIPFWNCRSLKITHCFRARSKIIPVVMQFILK